MKLHAIYANASGKGVWEHFKAGKPLEVVLSPRRQTFA